MKNLNELTNEEYQSFLDGIFDGVEYTGLVFETDSVNIDCCGVEYKMKDKIKRILSFSNPELIIWLYSKEVDLSIPLRQLRYDYVELDETNSILFEYAMDINRVLTKDLVSDARFSGSEEIEKIKAIKTIQKELVSKI